MSITHLLYQTFYSSTYRGLRPGLTIGLSCFHEDWQTEIPVLWHHKGEKGMANARPCVPAVPAKHFDKTSAFGFTTLRVATIRHHYYVETFGGSCMADLEPILIPNPSSLRGPYKPSRSLLDSLCRAFFSISSWCPMTICGPRPAWQLRARGANWQSLLL